MRWSTQPVGGVVLGLARDGAVALRTTSGSDGRFTFHDVPPANYDIQLESTPEEFSYGWSGAGSPSVAPGADVDVGTIYVFKQLAVLEPRAETASRPITYRWEAVTGATAYRVTISLTSGPTVVDEYVRGTQYEFTKATGGTDYYWCVLATDLAAGDIGLAEGCGSLQVR